MKHAVETTPAIPQLAGDGRQVGLVVDVELEDVNGLGQPLRRTFSHPPHASEAAENDRGPLALGLLGNVVGDRVFRDDAGDEQALARKDH